MKNNGLTIKVNGLTPELREKFGFSKVELTRADNGKESAAYTAKVGKKQYFLAVNWDSFRTGFAADDKVKGILDGSFKGTFKVTYKNGKELDLTPDTAKTFKYDGVDSAVIVDGSTIYLYTNRLSKSTVYGYDEKQGFILTAKVG